MIKMYTTVQIQKFNNRQVVA